MSSFDEILGRIGMSAPPVDSTVLRPDPSPGRASQGFVEAVNNSGVVIAKGVLVVDIFTDELTETGARVEASVRFVGQAVKP